MVVLEYSPPITSVFPLTLQPGWGFPSNSPLFNFSIFETYIYELLQLMVRGALERCQGREFGVVYHLNNLTEQERLVHCFGQKLQIALQFD